MAAGTKIHRIEMTDAEIESLLKKAGTSVLEPEEVEKLRQLVETLKYITVELEKKQVSVQRLKQMLFGPQSEKMSNHRLKKLLEQSAEAANVLGKANRGESNNEESAAAKEKQPGHGRRGADQYAGGEHEHVAHPTLKHKSPCPKCHKGKLALQNRPKVLVRLVGSAPVQAKVWTYDWLRCNSCGEIGRAHV